MRRRTRKILAAFSAALAGACLIVGLAACDNSGSYENPQTTLYTAEVASKKGDLISDAVVTWTNRDTGVVAAVELSDENGRAECDLRPAKYSVTVSDFSPTLYANRSGARFADEETTDVKFELDSIVTQTYVATVASATVAQEGAGIAWVNKYTGEIAGTALTDSEGVATLTLEATDYYVVLEEYSLSYIYNGSALSASQSSPRVSFELIAVTTYRPTVRYNASVTTGTAGVENISVVWYDSSNIPVYANYTNSAGSVAANIAEGEYIVRIAGYNALGYLCDQESVSVSATSRDAEFSLNRQFGAENSYSILVVSQGGMALRNVLVELVKNGETVASGITNSNGLVSLYYQFDNYNVSFTPPEGYYTIEGEDYTVDEVTHEYRFVLASKTIETTAPSGKTYTIGDVMYDFTVTDAETSEVLTLSNLLERDGYKAVVLNFWYINCQPCRAEFPYIDAAYKEYSSKLAFIALNYQDTVQQIREFKTGNSSLNTAYHYSFNMCYDNAGLSNMFNVSAFPTTIIIDRYGIVARATSGTQPTEDFWKSLFEPYVSDDYSQDNLTNGTVNPDDPEIVERPLPDVEWGDMQTVANAFKGEGLDLSAEQVFGEPDDAYSWPWPVKTGTEEGHTSYLAASNIGIPSSYSILQVQNISMKAGEALVFDYSMSSDTNDILYVLINEVIQHAVSGRSGGWSVFSAYIAAEDQNVKLSLIYRKDGTTDATDEHVYVDNLRLVDASELDTHTDIIRYAATGTDPKQDTGYANYVTVYIGDDGYYHVQLGSAPNAAVDPLLYADLYYATQFSALNVQAGNTYTSVYAIARMELGYETNYEEEFIVNGKNYMNQFSRWLRVRTHSTNGYVPVTAELKEFLEDFLHEIEYLGNYNTHTYENQWLEFCVYYNHYGNQNVPTAVYVASGFNPNADGSAYRQAEKTYLGEDGYYHVQLGEQPSSEDPLLYANLVDTDTAYAKVFLKNTLQKSIQLLVNNVMLVEDVNEKLVLDGVEYLETYQKFIAEQHANPTGYLPVTAEVQTFLKHFFKEIANAEKYGDVYGSTEYENIWLGVCVYYAMRDEFCNAFDDPTAGWTAAGAINLQYSLPDGGFKVGDRVLYFTFEDFSGSSIFRGVRYKFTAQQRGVYSFRGIANSDCDPYAYIVNPDYEEEVFAESQDYLDRYDGVSNDCLLYVYLEPGESVTIVFAHYQPAATGEYDVEVKYESSVGTLTHLKSADLGMGVSTYKDDEDSFETRYAAIPVALGTDGYYWAINDKGEKISPLYLSFFSQTLTIQQDYTILGLIEANQFDFRSDGYPNCTDTIMKYYRQSIQCGEGDEYYGLVKVNEELKDILDTFQRLIFLRDNRLGDYDSNRWVGMCWYYETVDSVNPYGSM